MSRENVELVRGAFEFYSREQRDPAAVSEFFTEDVVWNAADEEPQHGLDALIAYIRRWEAEWEELSAVAEELVDEGDQVLATVHYSARGRASGIEVDARYYAVFLFREGRIARMDEFADKAEALEAVGLRE